ncbi:MAG: hypothetical protein OS130_13770 [Thermodesulfobacteriota bacterium]|jgi:hypothetical protein|nr:MAG: hypothetical protein OS130_13770 [Thermodesulfobacteriota bacterium]
MVLGVYNDVFILTKCTDKTPNRWTFESESCTWPAYAFEYFGVGESDHVCVLWKDMSNAWLEGMIKAAGMTGKIRGHIDKSLCCGDGKCEFYLEYIV